MELPDDWVPSEADMNTALAADFPAKVTVIYNVTDTEITITRSNTRVEGARSQCH